MYILAIDTSCDETSAAVVDGRKVLSSVIYSQTLIHKEWGGVVPSLARRNHEERIDFVIDETLKKAKKTMEEIGAIAVTYGPGLAIALEVGIKKAKELGEKYNKPIIPVNHMEGHIYSCFVQNSKGNPDIPFEFPYLTLLISGAHTEIVIFKNHLEYEVIGKTVDDAAGEAIDKAGRMLGFGYPAGPVMERVAHEVNNIDLYKFPRPMLRSNNLNFSFSGLKTAFFYYLKKMPEEDKNTHIKELASSFQEAVFDTLLKKTETAVKQTGINKIVVGGGVAANMYLRKKMRRLAQKNNGYVLFPTYKYLTGDNGAMIGVVGSFKAEKKRFQSPSQPLDRVPRLSL